jgi:hypothetical protein
LLVGRVDPTEDGLVFGWIENRDEPDSAIKFDVLIDGTFVSEGTATSELKDYGEGAHGFLFVVPADWRDGEPHTLDIVLSDTKAVFLRKTIRVSKKHSIIGNLEAVSENQISGWVWDRAKADKPVQVDIIRNGKKVASGVANHYRGDLLRAGIGNGKHAFWVKIDGEPGEYTVQTSDSFGAEVVGMLTLEQPDPVAPRRAPAPPVRPNGKGASGNALPTAPAKVKAAPPEAPVQRTKEFEANLGKAQKKLRVVFEPNLFVHAKFWDDIRSNSISIDRDAVKLAIESPKGWVRILHLLPSVMELRQSDWRFAFQARVSTDPVLVSAVGLCIFDTAGSFRVVHRLAKSVSANADAESFSFALRKSDLSAFTDADSDSPVFLFLEFSSEATLSLFQFEVQGVQAFSGAPYTQSDFKYARRLTELNSSAATAGKHHLSKWLVDQAETALRFECFETASGLIRQVKIAELPPADRVRYLACVCEVCLAEGRTVELLQLLQEHISIVRDHDGIFTAYSLCFPPDVKLLPFLQFLPSGKLNCCYLAKMDAPGEAMKHLMTGDDVDQEQKLLLASQLRRVAPHLYLQLLNDYLKTFGLMPIKSIDMSGNNVLSRISFDTAPVQRAEADKNVSVVMSVFNSASTVGYAIESILRQSHANLELLVCDDCSTDSSLAAILKFQSDPRVRIFRSIKNQGTYNIRTALIKVANGRFLTFQDSDDFAHPQRLERQLSTYNSSGAKLVMGRWIRFRPDGEIAFFRDQRCLRMSVVSILGETGLFREFGGYRQVLCGADSEFFESVRLRYGASAFVELHEPLIFGLWSSQSLTQLSGLEATEDGFRSQPRRAYSEIAARHRLLGEGIIPATEIDAVNKSVGIYRPYIGVYPIEIEQAAKAEVGR